MTDIDVPDDLKHLFTYHAPQDGQVLLYERLRSAALDSARVIDESVPAGPDRTAATRKVREAVMTANAGIATGGGFYR